MNQPQSRIKGWAQPARPEWVKRINEEGRCLDISGIIPLDEDSLIKTAVANTGLTDFGDDHWREPFGVLVKGIEQEAELTLTGRILTRSDLLMFLEERLRVEDMYKRHPEIEDEEIVKPVWVIGQGRSGTSYLHTLLAQPPANVTTTDGHGMFPAPLPGMTPAEQQSLADKRITMWERVTPEVVSIHEFGADIPCEGCRIDAISFRSPAWMNLLGLAPSYNEYIANQKNNYEIVLADTKRVCKLLQWQNPGKQWILRSNDSIQYLPEVFKAFPDANLIWSHRDPVKSMSSMVDMIGTMMYIRSDRKITAAYEQVTNPAAVAPMLSQPIDWFESGAIPKDRLFNVYYPELVADPVGTIGKIYAHCGLDYDHGARQAIVDYVAEHPRTKRPAHKYSTGTAEQMQAERAAFKHYQDYFHVPNEI